MKQKNEIKIKEILIFSTGFLFGFSLARTELSILISDGELTLLIAVIGWLFALWLQRANAQQSLQNQIKYDVYKQLVDLNEKVQDSFAGLMYKVHPPFIMMESQMDRFL